MSGRLITNPGPPKAGLCRQVKQPEARGPPARCLPRYDLSLKSCWRRARLQSPRSPTKELSNFRYSRALENSLEEKKGPTHIRVYTRTSLYSWSAPALRPTGPGTPEHCPHQPLWLAPGRPDTVLTLFSLWEKQGFSFIPAPFKAQTNRGLCPEVFYSPPRQGPSLPSGTWALKESDHRYLSASQV